MGFKEYVNLTVWNIGAYFRLLWLGFFVSIRKMFHILPKISVFRNGKDRFLTFKWLFVDTGITLRKRV